MVEFLKGVKFRTDCTQFIIDATRASSESVMLDWDIRALRNVFMAFIFFFAAITSNASSSDYEQFERCYSRGYETKESLIESFSNSRESITAAYLKKKMVKGDDGLYRFYSERFLDGERCSNQCPEVQYVFHQCLLENLPSGKSKIKLRSALLVCSKVACDP